MFRLLSSPFPNSLSLKKRRKTRRLLRRFLSAFSDISSGLFGILGRSPAFSDVLRHVSALHLMVWPFTAFFGVLWRLPPFLSSVIYSFLAFFSVFWRFSAFPGDPPWFRSARTWEYRATRLSVRSIGHLLAHSLAHSLAPHYSLYSRAPLCSLVCSLANSLTPKLVGIRKV